MAITPSATEIRTASGTMKSAGPRNPMILCVGSWALSAAHGESVSILDVEEAG